MAKPTDLKTKYIKEILPELKKELGNNNEMALPKIEKVTINSGIGSYMKAHKNDYANVVENITKIAGQKPVITKAKKAISNFKIRENDIIGVTVTLRGKRMYDFLNKLINIVFPRVRDFRGLNPKSFDRNGNYNVGFKEHTVFPEISPDDVILLHGLEICITTTAQDDETGFLLLKKLGFPFKNQTT